MYRVPLSLSLSLASIDRTVSIITEAKVNRELNSKQEIPEKEKEWNKVFFSRSR